jgi:hypothetical protein
MKSAKVPIYHISFASQYLLAATFLRFQEYYESPKFSGKFFTLEEYMDWYAVERGSFSYFEDWVGFNIPSWVLKPFYEGKFDPLTEKEKTLLQMFKKISGEFYVIASVSGDLDTLFHEVVHGLFYLFPEYRKDVISCLRRFNTRSIERRLLKDSGYKKSVLNDEMNADILLDPKGDIETRVNAKLIEIFIRHFDCSPREESGRKKIFSIIHKWHFNYRV